MNEKKEPYSQSEQEKLKTLEQELLLLEEELPASGDLEEKIQKAITRKVRRIVYRTLGGMFLLLLVLLLVIHPVMNACFLNPLKLRQGDSDLFLKTLQCYWETTQPYAHPIYVDVKKKGFGCYDLNFQFIDNRNEVHFGISNVQADLNWGHYKNWQDPQFLTTFTVNRFDQTYKKQEEILAKIKELPSSSVLYLSLGADAPKSYEQLKEEDISLSWVEIYQPDCNFQGGITITKGFSTMEAPSREELGEEELKNAYLSNLNTLLEHTEVWRSMELKSSSKVFSPGYGPELLQECRDSLEATDELSIKNYCIFGKRDAIISYLEKEEFRSIQVDQIKLSDL